MVRIFLVLKQNSSDFILFVVCFQAVFFW